MSDDAQVEECETHSVRWSVAEQDRAGCPWCKLDTVTELAAKRIMALEEAHRHHAERTRVAEDYEERQKRRGWLDCAIEDLTAERDEARGQAISAQTERDLDVIALRWLADTKSHGAAIEAIFDDEKFAEMRSDYFDFCIDRDGESGKLAVFKQ